MLVVGAFIPPPAPDEVVREADAELPATPPAVPALPSAPLASTAGLAAPGLCGGGGVMVAAIASQKQVMLTPTRKMIIKVRFTPRSRSAGVVARPLATRAPPAHIQIVIDNPAFPMWADNLSDLWIATKFIPLSNTR